MTKVICKLTPRSTLSAPSVLASRSSTTSLALITCPLVATALSALCWATGEEL